MAEWLRLSLMQSIVIGHVAACRHRPRSVHCRDVNRKNRTLLGSCASLVDSMELHHGDGQMLYAVLRESSARCYFQQRESPIQASPKRSMHSLQYPGPVIEHAEHSQVCSFIAQSAAASAWIFVVSNTTSPQRAFTSSSLTRSPISVQPKTRQSAPAAFRSSITL